MDTLSAFAMGQANRHKESMVFDWDKAAQIIKEEKVKDASAGLAGDWGYTGGKIFENGLPVPEDETYVFLASTWATPQLRIDGKLIDCFKMESETENWDEETYWPESAKKILEE